MWPFYLSNVAYNLISEKRNKRYAVWPVLLSSAFIQMYYSVINCIIDSNVYFLSQNINRCAHIKVNIALPGFIACTIRNWKVKWWLRVSTGQHGICLKVVLSKKSLPVSSLSLLQSQSKTFKLTDWQKDIIINCM